MKLAVTGATGFIGTHVLRKAVAAGYQVRALCRENSNRRRVEHLPVEWIVGDIATTASWDELLDGADSLVHLAAAGVANLNDAFDAVRTNLPSHLLLFQAAARHGVRRLVLAGSCFEYGRTGDRIGLRGLREDDPLDPMNAYAAAKAAATLLAGPLTRDLGLECFILRPFHTYGEGELATRLIPAVIHACQAGQPVRTTDGRQVRDLVHVGDVAEAFLRAIQADWSQASQEPGTCVINVGTGRGTSIRAAVECLARLCGRDPAEVEFGAIPHRPHEMWRLVADVSAALRVLGWQPTANLESGLAEVVHDLQGRSAT